MTQPWNTRSRSSPVGSSTSRILGLDYRYERPTHASCVVRAGAVPTGAGRTGAKSGRPGRTPDPHPAAVRVPLPGEEPHNEAAVVRSGPHLPGRTSTPASEVAGSESCGVCEGTPRIGSHFVSASRGRQLGRRTRRPRVPGIDPGKRREDPAFSALPPVRGGLRLSAQLH